MTTAAVLDAEACRTIVETLATLLQLRWIFQQHPTTTIYSLLSAHGGVDTSRDYLLLKGVLSHGLTNELEFRVQQSGGERVTCSDSVHNVAYLEGLVLPVLVG